MEVLFYESVQNYSSCKSVEMKHVETLQVLIDELGNKFGKEFREYLLGEETCFFLVNGKSIMRTGGLKTPLKKGDKIEILPHVDAG
jgi:MoaD family protein